MTTATKVIVSAAVTSLQRAELERLAAEADHSLSAEIRHGLRLYLESRGKGQRWPGLAQEQR